MKISSRLYCLSILGIAGLLVMAIAAFVQFSSIEQDASNITKNTLPSVTVLNDVENSFSGSRRNVLLHILASPAEKSQFRTAFEQNKQQIYDKLKLYSSTLTADDKDRANINAVQAAMDEYYAKVPPVLAVSDQDQQEAARKLAMDTITPLSVKTSKTLQQAVDYNQVLLDTSSARLSKAISAGRTLLLTVSIIVGAVLLVGGLWIARQINTPLGALRDGLTTLSKDFDFTRRFDRSSKDEIADAYQALNGLLDVLQRSFIQLKELSQNVNQTAHSVATASSEMSQASQQVSESSASMSAAVEQMTVSIGHVADRAGQAEQSGQEAGQEASTGGKVIDDTIATIRLTEQTVQHAASQIEKLKEQTASIGAVVGVIKDIADQTNLLALNAAIEAARAGETGRGFAVVADEVRKLAERTAASTQEITSTVTLIQEGANETVASMQQVVAQVGCGMSQAEQATTAIHRIMQSSEGAVAQVAEISSAMREQSLASSSIAQQVERIAQMTEESHAGAANTADSAEALRRAAHTMQETIQTFRV